MIVLGIETTTKIGSVALAQDDHVAEHMLPGQMNHSEKILVAIDHLLKSQHVAIKDVQRVAVSVGPGSFTGIRIGVTVGRIIGQITAKETVAVSTLDALAFSVKGQKEIVCPLINAIAGEVYYAFYEQGTLMKKISPYVVSDGKTLCKAAAQFERKVLFLGEGLMYQQAYIQDVMKEKALFAGRDVWMPRAGAISCLGSLARPLHWSKLSPHYIRPSEAERMWKGRGRNKTL